MWRWLPADGGLLDDTAPDEPADHGGLAERVDFRPRIAVAAFLLAALIGDAAERFVRREHGDPPDEGLVETMLHLLDAKGR